MILADEEATAAVGRLLGERVRQGDVVTLSGPLGVGKTALVRAMLRALGHEGEVPSPSFAIVQLSLALILLFGTGLLARSFTRLMQWDPGFEPHHVVTVRAHHRVVSRGPHDGGELPAAADLLPSGVRSDANHGEQWRKKQEEDESREPNHAAITPRGAHP